MLQTCEISSEMDYNIWKLVFPTLQEKTLKSF